MPKKPEDMNLDELKIAYFDNMRNLEVIQHNQNMLVEAITKKEEEKKEPEKKDEKKPTA